MTGNVVKENTHAPAIAMAYGKLANGRGRMWINEADSLEANIRSFESENKQL